MTTNAAGQSVNLLLEVIEVLNKEKIEYAVIGAIAASYHGLVRASLDADAILSIYEEDYQKLRENLEQEFDQVTLRKGDLSDPLFGLILIEDKFGNRVDLILGIRGMDREMFSRTDSATLLNRTVQIVSVEDFIAMKLFAGSAKDIEDARSALAVSGESIDQELLQKLTENYGQEQLTLLKKLSKE